MILDGALILIALLSLSALLISAIVRIRAAQQGIVLPADLQQLDQALQLRLIGVDGFLAYIVLQNLIFVAVPVVRTRIVRRESLATLGLTLRRPLRMVGYGLVAGIVLLAVNIVLGLIFAGLGVRQNQRAQYPLFAGDYTGQFLFGLAVATVVPFGEEVLARGYIQSTLARLVPHALGRWLAIIGSALVFASAHLASASEGVIAVVVSTFWIGLALGWIRQRTGSLLPTIVAHGVNNAVAVSAAIFCANNAEICRRAAGG